jgi:4-diphosphocytidyl-2-C-methyl-D-erythritol kinase
MRVEVLCPAKLNLFLSVGKVDRRGYHPIRTIFQAISIFDKLTIETSSRIEFSSNSDLVPAENTVTKAARLLQEIADYPPVAISLDKQIPIQSGLGGGSSDAAGLIRTANEFMSMRLPDHERKAIAKSVGADVPFFLVGGRARGEGYGEKLMPLAQSDAVEWYVIAQPEDRCSTGETFAKLDQLDYEWIDFPETDVLYNDFERVAPCGSLDLLERLQVHGAKDSGLTGSGSAVFGRFVDEESAIVAARKMEREAPYVQVAHSL